MIENVIFDVGRVLVEYEPLEYLEKLGYDEVQRAVLNEHIFENKIWKEFDRGTYTYEEGIEIFCDQRPDLLDDIRRILHPHWLAELALKEDTVAFLKELKNSGYQVYILSNFSSGGFQYMEELYDIFSYADGKIISGDVKLIKPDPAIYQCLLDTFHLVPEECVFIDDLEVNIEAAKQLGIHGIVFTNMEDVRKAFHQLIVG